MAFDVSGKVVAVYPTVQRSSTFQTREFVIEKSDDIGGRIISNYIKFQAVQDRTAILDKISVGEEVKVHFNLRGSKWMKDGRENYITNLDAWRIETFVQSGTPVANTPPPTADFDPTSIQHSNVVNDDLPF